MDEPVGHTIDGTPWEEARGPHLPDRLTGPARRLWERLPRASWIFVGVAVANGLVLARDGGLSSVSDAALDPGTIFRIVVGSLLALVPPIATMLFGAALFACHPRAWTTHRVLVVGLILMTLSETMQTADAHLSNLFLAWTPPPDDFFFPPGQIVWNALATVLLAVGTATAARGLSAMREQEGGDTSRSVRVVASIAVLLVVWSIVVSIVFVSRYAGQGVPAPYTWYAWLTTGLQWFVIAAVAYLAVVVFAGMAARERPIVAWRLAAAGAWATLLFGNGFAVAIDTVTYTVATPQTDLSDWSWVYLLPAAGWALGAALLLAAFARGLPSEEDAGDLTPTPGPPAAPPRGCAGS